MQEMAQADYLLWVAPSIPRSADGVFAPDRDVEHTSRGAVALNPGFELAGARSQREIGKRALGRVRAQLDLTAGTAELDVGHGRKSPGREVSGQVESPLMRDLDFPGAQVIGAPAGSRPAPILACQDGRVLRCPPISIRTGANPRVAATSLNQARYSMCIRATIAGCSGARLCCSKGSISRS